MSRELKFRAWDKEREEMYDVISIRFPYEMMWVKTGQGTEFTFFSKVVIVQYTGLQDKHGNDIYDKDILRYNDGEIRVVEFPNDFLQVKSECQQAEVIGSALQNPDLLKS